MSKGQTTIFLDMMLKERLRAEAARRDMSMSLLAKALIGEGMDRLDDGNGTFPRPILEEILKSIFSIEETVLMGFFDSRVKPEMSKDVIKTVLDEIITEARKRTWELLSAGEKDGQEGA